MQPQENPARFFLKNLFCLECTAMPLYHVLHDINGRLDKYQGKITKIEFENNNLRDIVTVICGCSETTNHLMLKRV